MTRKTNTDLLLLVLDNQAIIMEGIAKLVPEPNASFFKVMAKDTQGKVKQFKLERKQAIVNDEERG